MDALYFSLIRYLLGSSFQILLFSTPLLLWEEFQFWFIFSKKGLEGNELLGREDAFLKSQFSARIGGEKMSWTTKYYGYSFAAHIFFPLFSRGLRVASGKLTWQM